MIVLVDEDSKVDVGGTIYECITWMDLRPCVIDGDQEINSVKDKVKLKSGVRSTYQKFFKAFKALE